MSLAIYPILIIAAAMVLGLLGAPFAALVCLIISRVRRLDSSFAGTGARYSMLFIVPWIYLVLRMLGVQVSDRLVQIGYAILYGVWLYAAILATVGGLAYPFISDEHRIGDMVLLISGGLFIACFWFVSLRRLLRRNDTSPIEPSTPMRIAYTTLHALWLLFAIGMVLAGMFEANVMDNSDAASVLYIASFVMGVIWVVAMFRFRFRKADEWDYHASRPHSELPLHGVYIEPFAHLHLLIVIPALCGIVMWFISIMLWFS